MKLPHVKVKLINYYLLVTVLLTLFSVSNNSNTAINYSITPQQLTNVTIVEESYNVSHTTSSLSTEEVSIGFETRASHTKDPPKTVKPGDFSRQIFERGLATIASWFSPLQLDLNDSADRSKRDIVILNALTENETINGHDLQVHNRMPAFTKFPTGKLNFVIICTNACDIFKI